MNYKSYNVKVTGISSKGVTHSILYGFVYARDTRGALQYGLDYADNEYNSEYDENHKAIPGSTYKEFEQITSVEIVEEC